MLDRAVLDLGDVEDAVGQCAVSVDGAAGTVPPGGPHPVKVNVL